MLKKKSARASVAAFIWQEKSNVTVAEQVRCTSTVGLGMHPWLAHGIIFLSGSLDCLFILGHISRMKFLTHPHQKIQQAILHFLQYLNYNQTPVIRLIPRVMKSPWRLSYIIFKFYSPVNCHFKVLHIINKLISLVTQTYTLTQIKAHCRNTRWIQSKSNCCPYRPRP